MLLLRYGDAVAFALTHFASALVFPIVDSILELVTKDIPDVLLVAVFKHVSE